MKIKNLGPASRNVTSGPRTRKVDQSYIAPNLSNKWRKEPRADRQTVNDNQNENMKGFDKTDKASPEESRSYQAPQVPNTPAKADYGQQTETSIADWTRNIWKKNNRSDLDEGL